MIFLFIKKIELVKSFIGILNIIRQRILKYLLQKALTKILLSPPPLTYLDKSIKSLLDLSSLPISGNFEANSPMFVSIHPMLAPVDSIKPLTKADARF